MKKCYLILLSFFFFTCSSSDENEVVKDDTTPSEFIFEYNLHSSLPNDWTTEFYKIMDVLKKVTHLNRKTILTNFPYMLGIVILISHIRTKLRCLWSIN